MSWRHVYRWDLDKTYLNTDFESLRRLVGIAFERPEEKVNVPGSAALLRELCRGIEGQAPSRICIISGSPRQMRRTLEKKLEIDGVRWDEFHLKPQWENLRRGRFRAVRDQVGYKLPLLLRSRRDTDGVAEVPETLFGDDAEADAFIYSLYADLLAGRVSTDSLVTTLKAAGAYSDAVDASVEASKTLEGCDAVERIFIHLDSRTPPAFFRPFGPRVVPVYNYFQAALVLFSGGHLAAEGVVTVTRAFLEAEGHSAASLANLFQDVVRRGHLPASAMQELALGIQEIDDVADEAEVIWKSVQRFTDLGPGRRFMAPSPPEDLDYPRLLDHLRSREG
jgi:hypothetical protein